MSYQSTLSDSACSRKVLQGASCFGSHCNDTKWELQTVNMTGTKWHPCIRGTVNSDRPNEKKKKLYHITVTSTLQ